MGRKYKIQYLEQNKRYNITVPTVLVESMGKAKGTEAVWKLHPDGKNLILEFV